MLENRILGQELLIALESYYEDSPNYGYLYKNPVTVFINQLNVNYTLGDYAKTIEYYQKEEKVLETADSHTRLRAGLLLAKSYLAAGNEVKMLETCEALKKEEKISEEPYKFLACYYAKRGELAVCNELFRELYERAPQPYYLEIWIEFLIKEEMHDALKELLKKPLDGGYLERRLNEWRDLLQVPSENLSERLQEVR